MLIRKVFLQCGQPPPTSNTCHGGARTHPEDVAYEIKTRQANVADLNATVEKEGEDAHNVYVEFAEWCEDTSEDVI